MVVIVDPHLKRTSNYPAFQEASDRKVLVKPPSGEGEYEGWCWSGSSSWTDFFDPNSWDWWKSLFKTTALKSGWSWTSSTTDIHIWNDMNEVIFSLILRSTMLTSSVAFSFQWPGDFDAEGQRPLRRLGTS
jgi:alpha-glucosidase (family GH31 glycosyl hydrolase)